MSGAWSVEQGDAVESLRALDACSVDLICTDPAYESLERHRKRGTTTRLSESDGSSNVWFPIFGNQRMPSLLAAMYAALKPERHAYLLCDEETSDVVKPLAEEAGFYVWKTIVWVKTLSASIGEPTEERTAASVAAAQVRRGMGYHFAACTERILFLEKRSKAYQRASTALFGRDLSPKKDPPGKGRAVLGNYHDVLFAPRVTGYPTEKPIELLRPLIEASTGPGELVVDPFCGSGSTGEAAVSLGRRAKLYDVLPGAVEHSRVRLTAIGGDR